MSAKSRIFVVDDHPIVRQGLALLINREPDMMVCGEAEEGHAALRALAVERLDLLILDISLDGPDGIELIKTIRGQGFNLPILVLSMHDETTYAERALRAGANGYIMKQEATEKVLVAIRRIVKGDVYLSEEVSSKMLKHYVRGLATPEHSPLEELSDRELEVFRLVGAGRPTREIAEQLHLSIKTVESYQAHIKVKLSFHDSGELVQRAVEWNLVEKKT